MNTSAVVPAKTSEQKFSINFAFDDADIYLRTCDNIIFKVHRWPLSSASEVFRDMFTFGSTSTSQLPMVDDIPIVNISEDRKTMDILLRFLYHQFDIPELKSMLDADRLLIAADKYNIRRIASFVKQQMTNRPSLCDTNIFLAYIIACKEPRASMRVLLRYILYRVIVLDWRKGEGKEQLGSVINSHRISAEEYFELDKMQHSVAIRMAAYTLKEDSLRRRLIDTSNDQISLAVAIAGHPGRTLILIEKAKSLDDFSKGAVEKLRREFGRVLAEIVDEHLNKQVPFFHYTIIDRN